MSEIGFIVEGRCITLIVFLSINSPLEINVRPLSMVAFISTVLTSFGAS